MHTRDYARHSANKRQIINVKNNVRIMLALLFSFNIPVIYNIFICLVMVHGFSDKLCNVHHVQIVVVVLNSAVNPLAYALFKRDIKKELYRLILR